MRELGLVACQPRPWRPSTTKQGQAGPIPDLVNRDFTAAAPGEKMVGDITYIPTWQGWLYLATVIDCATRKVIGWAMDDNYRTPLIARRSRWPPVILLSRLMPSFTATAEAIIRPPSSRPSWNGSGSASRWAGRGYVSTMLWPSRSMRR